MLQTSSTTNRGIELLGQLAHCGDAFANNNQQPTHDRQQLRSDLDGEHRRLRTHQPQLIVESIGLVCKLRADIQTKPLDFLTS